MTGMSFSVEILNDELSVESFRNEMAVTTLAFIKAQKECGLFDTEVNDIVNIILVNPYQDYSFLEYGIHVACDVEYSGFEMIEGSGTLWSEEGAETFYSLKFTIKKESL